MPIFSQRRERLPDWRRKEKDRKTKNVKRTNCKLRTEVTAERKATGGRRITAGCRAKEEWQQPAKELPCLGNKDGTSSVIQSPGTIGIMFQKRVMSFIV
ncbi:Hypothetical protein FKW44_023145 [Caligus rogercresseyi]|uniref:Uncharacterized protein n=1 Tax=Caligus rogercresseyi TaxID=217165 RepID=A0A7T8JTY1_CALRO|nr:Hypothetical protein FKW44_023145 [Caligus rogercresseyi]